MNMNETITNVTLTKVVSISPDNESKKEGLKKTITLQMRYDGLTLGEVFQKALKDDVISWANGSGGRKAFDKLTDKQTIKVFAKAPGSSPAEAPEDAFSREAKAAGVDLNNEKELTAYIIRRMKTAKA